MGWPSKAAGATRPPATPAHHCPHRPRRRGVAVVRAQEYAGAQEASQGAPHPVPRSPRPRRTFNEILDRHRLRPKIDATEIGPAGCPAAPPRAPNQVWPVGLFKGQSERVRARRLIPAVTVTAGVCWPPRLRSVATAGHEAGLRTLFRASGCPRHRSDNVRLRVGPVFHCLSALNVWWDAALHRPPTESAVHVRQDQRHPRTISRSEA